MKPTMRLSNKAYEVWVAVRKRVGDDVPGGEVLSGYCTCPAGLVTLDYDITCTCFCKYLHQNLQNNDVHWKGWFLCDLVHIISVTPSGVSGKVDHHKSLKTDFAFSALEIFSNSLRGCAL